MARRIGPWLAVLLSGCAFEGAAGTAGGVGDDGPDAGPDLVDAPPATDPTPPPPGRCDGFKAVGGSKYRVSTAAMSWSDAKNECDAVGIHLATFETVAEAATVAQGFPLTSTVWTGVIQNNSSRISGNWVNLAAGNAVPTPFPWDGGEPNDGGGWFPSENGAENHAELRTNGRFNDQYASRLNRALCECDEEE
ncbi:MAG: C-type lectin domain-containing protein [Kofleriaceae bacterium]